MHPYREPAERPIAKANRIPGRVLVGVGTAVCALVAGALIIGACRTTQVERIVTPPAPVITSLPDKPEILFEGTWPGLDVRLLGIDAKKGEAAIELVQTGEQPRRVFDTIDYQHHALVDQWEIPSSKDNYPPAWNGEFDLAHMARYIRLRRDSMFPFGLDPMMAVDPSAAGDESGAIVYDAIPKDGHDGDNLFMVDHDGKNPRRIDNGLVASYDPMFSPDGAFLAWRACGRPCKYFLFVTDVKKRAPVRVAAVEDPRNYAWSADGKTLWALARPKQDAAAFFRVERNGKATEIFRGDVQDAELEVASDRTVAVIGGRNRFVFVDLETGDVIRERALDVGNLMSVGPKGILFSTDRAGAVAYDPRTEKQAFFPSDGWYVQPWYAAWEAPNAVMVVRTKGSTMQLVRLHIRL
jgi:hypothetical protein